MSDDKVLEDLALGYAVGGSQGLGLVGWFFVAKLFIFPTLFLLFAIVWTFSEDFLGVLWFGLLGALLVTLWRQRRAAHHHQ
jgi:hypothetical protein